MSVSIEKNEQYAIKFCEYYEQKAKEIEEIEEEDKQRIIKILLRMNPYFDFEDLYRYKLIFQV